MALVVCPECGREKISMMAAACPDCGFPISEHFKMQVDQVYTKETSELQKRCSIGDAQAVVDINNEMKRLCDEFLEKIGENADSFKFTPKLKKGLQIPDDAIVYLAHDDTMFNSGKNGFAITNQGIYCRDLMENTEVTSLDELSNLTELSWEDVNKHNNIISGEKKLVYYTDGEEEVENALISLLSDIIQLLSGKRIEAPKPTVSDKGEIEGDMSGQGILAQATGSQNMGYCSVNNVQGFTDEILYEKLSTVKVSFGIPIMGDINGTPSVLYKNITDNFDIFCRVNGKNVIMGKIGADGISSIQTAAREGLSIFLGYNDENTSTANRAVDELCGVIQKLESGENVTESAAAAMGEAISLYMIQKALSLKPKFDIVDQDNNSVYHIEGDLTRLNFSIQRSGEEVLKLKKKLVAIMPEYTIEKNNAEIAKIKKKFKLTNPELIGQVQGKELKINGNLFGYDFDIMVGGVVIGHVDKDYGYWSDHYRIRSFDAGMQDVVIALAIICDNVADSEESNS